MLNDPSLNAEFYYNRGTAYHFLGDYPHAIDDFSKAIEIEPPFLKAYLLRGDAYLSLDNYQQAIKDFDKAIELDPDNCKAYHNRGNAYYGLGDYQAKNDYRTAIKLDPGRAETTTTGDYANDVDMMEPIRLPIHFMRGSAYFDIGDYEQAIEDFSKSIKLDPNNYKAEAYFRRGNAYDKLGDFIQAIKNYSKAIELDPKLICKRVAAVFGNLK